MHQFKEHSQVLDRLVQERLKKVSSASLFTKETGSLSAIRPESLATKVQADPPWETLQARGSNGVPNLSFARDSRYFDETLAPNAKSYVRSIRSPVPGSFNHLARGREILNDVIPSNSATPATARTRRKAPFSSSVAEPKRSSLPELEKLMPRYADLAVMEDSNFFGTSFSSHQTLFENTRENSGAVLKSIAFSISGTSPLSFEQGSSDTTNFTFRVDAAFASAPGRIIDETDLGPSAPRLRPTIQSPVNLHTFRDNAIGPSAEVAQRRDPSPIVLPMTVSPQKTPERNSVPSPSPRGFASPASDVLSPEPVLLMHQEFLSGATWFIYTDDAGGVQDHLLPFSLVDAGYDVWIGHHRATRWGHEHRYLSHEDQEYWAWTWDDLAEFDISAILEFISMSSKLPVHLIGVSQSATAGAAAATMPKVQRRLKSLTLIGPTAYTGDTNSNVLEAWAYVLGRSLDQVFYESGYQHGAFNFSTAFPPFMRRVDGHGPIAAALNSISGPNCCLGSAVVTFNNGWDGTTSFKNLLHIQQGLRKGTWSKFDYGDSADNRAVYGSTAPPAYKPAGIPASLLVLVIYGGQDATAPTEGVGRFMSELSVPPAVVYLPRYAHADLTFSTNRTSDVFKPLIDFLNSVPETNT